MRLVVKQSVLQHTASGSYIHIKGHNQQAASSKQQANPGAFQRPSCPLASDEEHLTAAL